MKLYLARSPLFLFPAILKAQVWIQSQGMSDNKMSLGETYIKAEICNIEATLWYQNTFPKYFVF